MRGPGSACTTAAAVASWETAFAISQHEWGSTMPWHTLFDDAIDYTRNGTQVSASHGFWIDQRKSLLDTLPDIKHLCRNKHGHFLQAGDHFSQPHLANTLEQLAKAGARDFYQGDIAREIARGFDDIGCGLTLNDLQQTRAEEIQPLSVRYRNGHFFNFPPPSQGLYTLHAMATLNKYDLQAAENGSTDYYHLLVEAIKSGLLLRNQELCDPAHPGTGKDWDFFCRLQPGVIDTKTAANWTEIGQPADTVWMAATDAKGRTACLMQSLFHDFGSGCVMGNSGIVWHNRGGSFHHSKHSDHPNVWAPGKRPAHTLNPSCYIADNGERFFFGSQGGDGQPQTQLVLASQLIDFNRTPQQALSTPRFLLGRSFFDSTDNLKLEANIHADVIRELEDRGHQTEIIPALSPYTGHAGVLVQGNHSVQAAHDPRGEGTARAL